MQTSPPIFSRCLSPAEIIAGSKLFQDYQRVFVAATGLLAELRNPDSTKLDDWPTDRINLACARLGLGGRSCEACRRFNEELARAAVRSPQTRECPAGLCETFVPVRNGNRVLALLQVGQVRLRAPRHEDVERVRQLTRSLGAETSPERLMDALWQVHYLSAMRYASLVQLLEIFSRQLAEWFVEHAPAARPRGPLAVLRVREWIESHYHEPVSLSDAAKVAQISSWQLSRRFHGVTGVPFRIFLSRTRVNHAMRLLADPQNRINEVATAVGFCSISQFNRTFRALTGQTPSEYRASVVEKGPCLMQAVAPLALGVSA